MRHARTVEALLSDDGFRVAFVVATLGGILAVTVTRRWHLPIGLGLAAVVGVLAGVRTNAHLAAALVAGVAVLAAGTRIAQVRRLGVRLAATVPGALLISAAVPHDFPGWMRAFAIGATVATAPLAVASNRHIPRATYALLAVSALGVYWCVPDTEQALALAGAMMPTAVLGLASRRGPSPAGVGAVTGLLVWTATVGGVGRAGSVIGATACLGVLLVVPIANGAGLLPVTAAHLALVVVSARGAGRLESALAASVVVAAALGVAVAGLRLAARRSSRRG
jgi:hypothetical protein